MALFMTRSFYLLIFLFSWVTNTPELPKGFVYIDEVMPDVVYDIRYSGAHNFVGKPINGYQVERAILSAKAAQALKNVQAELIRKDYMLKIYDAYRPQRAVNHFMDWARDESDTIMKAEFYPEVQKRNLFSLGYIATRSGHSRGGTVDLTLIHVENCENVDMGSLYDFFGKISHHRTTQITAEQKQNREQLRLAMRKYGFRSYSEEWWHYTYDAEPFPDTYFDFPVE